jgi:hypothetical protein
MADEQGLFVSHKQIQAWKDQIADLQKKVAAGETLLGMEETKAFTPVNGPEASFMGSMVRFVKEAKEPLSRNDLRNKLRAIGFSQEKIIKQFNTVLYKTMQVERIIYAADGMKLVKGPNA